MKRADDFKAQFALKLLAPEPAVTNPVKHIIPIVIRIAMFGPGL